MRRPQSVSSGSLERILEAAEGAWKQRQFSQGIALAERAARLNPGNAKVLLALGRYHGLRYDSAAAEACFDKAVGFAADKAKTLALAAEKCVEFGAPLLAERYYRRALERAEISPEAMVQFAEFSERRHRLEEASELVNRALRLNPGCGVALLARARLERQAGLLEQAEKTVRLFLGQPDPGLKPGFARDMRIRGWYELGAILDLQKRFDEAMAAFLQAKSMLRLYPGEQIAGMARARSSLKQLRDSITAEKLQTWFELGPQLQPHLRVALLCGHPRSGTTLIEQVLDAHPDIVSIEERSVFLDDAMTPFLQKLAGRDNTAPLLVAALRESRENYFRCAEKVLGQPMAGRLLIDKNPLLTLPVYFSRIFPEAKFLMAMRDPRDVCLSEFMQSFSVQDENSAFFWSLESTIEEYSLQMSLWTTVAPMIKNSWMEVRYEQVVEDLESVSRRVLEFLGLAWDARVMEFNQHARQKYIRTPTYADVAKPVFRTAVGRWRNYRKYFEPHLDRLAPFLQAFGYAD